ncbi:leucine-rich repeat protein [Catovirus CTV1]|uniref:Leucine-rich repeat protein n=1 Tax=Catovirus CTV1 TaxID=1977631 RepID=A0A1V0SBX6_9VIRU|nr:leucine-rich repeat protein [Catovirus CTV1]
MNIKKQSKYSIYENDLKFKNYRDLNPKKIDWNTGDLQKKYYNENYDSLEYRYSECKEKNNLLYLDLSHLDLKQIPKVPHDICDSIKYLFMNNNNLDQITGIEQFKKLQVLDISNNGVTEISKLPPSLKELSCRFNKISCLPFISELKILDCTSNKIRNLELYPNLEILICQDNEIQEIPKYNYLRKLVCCDNIVQKIRSYKFLEYLDCANNCIMTIGELPKIKDLICRNNELNSIPSNLPELKYLDIHGNILEILEFYPKLKELYCDTTGVKKISSGYKISQSNVYNKDKCYILFK